MGLQPRHWQEMKDLFRKRGGFEPAHRKQDFINLQREMKQLGIDSRADLLVTLWRRFVEGIPQRDFVRGSYLTRRPYDAFRADLGRLLAQWEKLSGSARSDQKSDPAEKPAKAVAPRHIPKGL